MATDKLVHSDGDAKPVLDFDALVLYAREDRDQVRAICAEADRRGLKLLIDDDFVLPGTNWRLAVREAIGQARKVVVVCGASGIGPCQEDEILHLLNQRTIRKIPVLLPEVQEFPELIGLNDKRPVDFQTPQDADALDNLVWAVTDHKPDRSPGLFQIQVDVPQADQTCFVAMSDDDSEIAGHLFGAMLQAAKDAEMQVKQTRDGMGEGFSGNVEKSIRAAELIVADCRRNGDGTPAPDVLYELGLAKALGKPIILLVDVADAKRLPCRFLTVKELVEYDSRQADFAERLVKDLAARIREIIGGIRYPYLIERDLDDIAVTYAGDARVRPLFWERLQTILSIGIDFHHRFRNVAKHTHQLVRDINRVYEEATEIASPRTRDSHWEVFRAALEAFWQSHLEEIEQQLRESILRNRDRLAKAFAVLRQKTENDARQLLHDAHDYYQMAQEALGRYDDFHTAVLDTLSDGSVEQSDVAAIQALVVSRLNEMPPSKRDIAFLRSYINGLNEEAEVVQMHIHEMLLKLLELIGTDREHGGLHYGP